MTMEQNSIALENLSSLSREHLEKRLMRERNARIEAERLLEKNSSQIYKVNNILRSTTNQLSIQSSQFQIILDNTLAAILLVDDDNSIIRANKEAHRQLGFEGEELFGHNVKEFISGCDEKISALKSAHSDTIEEVPREEFTGIKQDGSQFPIECSVSVADLNDRCHTVWIFRDITHRKEQNAERERLENELRHALKLESLGTLASGIAHEINSPVQFVGDNLHFLAEAMQDVIALIQERLAPVDAEANHEADDGIDLDFLVEEIPTAISQSIEGIERVNHIVTSVREFSHPGDKDVVPTDLNAAVESTVTISRNQWKYVSDLNTELSDGLEMISCVPGDLNQVILNLIVNAAQAIEEKGGSEKGQIDIKTRSLLSHVELRVSDTGKGIEPEHINRIFDPFYTTKEVGKGTGQGLSLAYNMIVTKYGGKILAESEPGKGATFIILLPKDQQKTSEVAA